MPSLSEASKRLSHWNYPIAVFLVQASGRDFRLWKEVSHKLPLSRLMIGKKELELVELRIGWVFFSVNGQTQPK